MGLAQAMEGKLPDVLQGLSLVLSQQLCSCHRPAAAFRSLAGVYVQNLVLKFRWNRVGGWFEIKMGFYS